MAPNRSSTCIGVDIGNAGFSPLLAFLISHTTTVDIRILQHEFYSTTSTPERDKPFESPPIFQWNSWSNIPTGVSINHRVTPGHVPTTVK